MAKLYNCKHKPLYLIIKQLFSDFDLSRHKRVFIKPNLGGRYPIIKGENTRYDILNCICKVFGENGCQEIVIGHGSLLNFSYESKYDFESLIAKSNFYKLTKYKIAKLLNLDKASRRSVKIKDITFSVPDITQTHFYINLCNLKTHMETVVSLSLKNQVGLLPADERMRKHKTDLDRHIAYLGAAVKPSLNIIDGRIGMEGNGPHHGSPKRADMILCGTDMVEADSFACCLIDIDYNSVEQIKIAIEENVGNPIKHEQFDLYKKYSVKFRLPDEFYGKYHHLRVWPNKACSACIFVLSDAHKTIRKNPIKLIQFINKFIKTKNFDIVLGKNAEANACKYSNDIFAVGNCMKDFVKVNSIKNFLPGCPPDRKSIIKFLSTK